MTTSYRKFFRPQSIAAVAVVTLCVGCESNTDSLDPADIDNSAATFVPGSFCEGLPRPEWSRLEKHAATTDWFQVYQVAENTFAIYEPFQWQEVISYLIIGEDRALLFDTGNGIGDIRSVVEALTNLPVIVANSHSHFDHVGGNHQFSEILSVSTAFALERSQGLPNSADLQLEVSAQALCKPLPNAVDPATHVSRPYAITKILEDGSLIDLGGRVLTVVRTPGHTDDSIGLLEKEQGFFWSGDSFYEGPIWLYAPETDLDAYALSVEQLADLAPSLKAVFPAHNSTPSDPELLISLRDNFERVMAGEVAGSAAGNEQIEYRFDDYSFLMRGAPLMPDGE